MKRLILTFITVISLFTSVLAQQNDVLFTINEKPVYVSEFERVYKKNLDLVQDDNQKNIDSYFDLFVNYKLKLEEAYNQKLNEKPSYQRELKGYERQLIQKYINDSEVTEKLVLEAYNRLKKEIDANHVLVKLDPNASPEQEAEALKEIKRLRDRVIKDGFDTVQKEEHNGNKIYAENLGYFTAFKMVYNFENAAYTTQKGEVSAPFKTQYGYHVVIVNDVRDNRGEVTVAHIMVEEKELVDQLYKRLEQGEDFKSLAKQYSIDKSTSGNGGVLRPFVGGQLSSSVFEDNAFALKEIGDLSQPFKTNFGWHIAKLYAKKGMDTFEAEKNKLQTKVKRDTRSQILNDKRVAKLLLNYNLNYSNVNLIDFENGLNDRFYKGLWNAPENLKSDKVLVTIKKEEVTYNEFTKFLTSVQRKPQERTTFKAVVKKYYKDFLDAKVTKYQETHLIDENQDFANIYNEYKEGLLLFELMGSQIWNSSVNDSIALQDYFNANKKNYKFKKRVVATIASSAKKRDAKTVLKLLKSGLSQEAIEKKLNTDNVVVTFNSGTFNNDALAMPSKLKKVIGLSKIYKHNNAFVIVNIESVLPANQKTFEEAKGSAMSDFQDQKEIQWISELKKKYPVTINKLSLETLKAKYN